MKIKHILFFVAICFCSLLSINAQDVDFDTFFENKTLRIDYVFSGGKGQVMLSPIAYAQLPNWAGRRTNLTQSPTKHIGNLFVRDKKTGQLIYTETFSTLFQEWLELDEAKTSHKALEKVFLIPFPKNPIEVEIQLANNQQDIFVKSTESIDPTDILILKKLPSPNVDKDKGVVALLGSLDSYQDKINIALVPEGYANDNETFLKHAQEFVDTLISYAPFSELKHRLNVFAVPVSSSLEKEEGVTIPKKDFWRNTLFGSHFSTFHSDRYLTTPNKRVLHDLLVGIPYEHIIIFANSKEYGGGGFYNTYATVSTKGNHFARVAVHEFGHSFGGLADEYFYEKEELHNVLNKKKEPFEKNITTLVDFKGKWETLFPKGVKPTRGMKSINNVGLVEHPKGTFRCSKTCRMLDNKSNAFCPACQKALREMINFYVPDKK